MGWNHQITRWRLNLSSVKGASRESSVVSHRCFGVCGQTSSTPLANHCLGNLTAYDVIKCHPFWGDSILRHFGMVISWGISLIIVWVVFFIKKLFPERPILNFVGIERGSTQQNYTKFIIHSLIPFTVEKHSCLVCVFLQGEFGVDGGADYRLHCGSILMLKRHRKMTIWEMGGTGSLHR